MNVPVSTRGCIHPLCVSSYLLPSGLALLILDDGRARGKRTLGTEPEIKARHSLSPRPLSDNDMHNEDSLRLSYRLCHFPVISILSLGFGIVVIEA